MSVLVQQLVQRYRSDTFDIFRRSFHDCQSRNRSCDIQRSGSVKLTITAFTATGITTIDASASTATTSMNVASNVSANIISYTGGLVMIHYF